MLYLYIYIYINTCVITSIIFSNIFYSNNSRCPLFKSLISKASMSAPYNICVYVTSNKCINIGTHHFTSRSLIYYLRIRNKIYT
ncbi:hypothetical protein [Camelpox virus]|uniref:Uncharacterized protein n=1 Tax=Camelpox virus (strain M-96) TaxID=203173 RepID=Q8V2I4_CAMPM|nr:Hypothetical protein CamMLVgp195 [Camelpox virus]AAL73902.1 hypothetical protein [Camelpox virus M-96]